MKPGIEKLQNGETRGLDPRNLTEQQLAEIGHTRQPLLKALRAKCVDCSHAQAEAARCTAVDCSLWPYRMGTNPFRAAPSDARRAAGSRLAELSRIARGNIDEERGKVVG